MHGLLHLRIEILHANRGAIETDFAQRDMCSRVNRRGSISTPASMSGANVKC